MGEKGTIFSKIIAIKFEHQTLKQQKLLCESVISDSRYSTLQHIAETCGGLLLEE